MAKHNIIFIYIPLCVPLSFNTQSANMNLDNGLVPSRWQAIAWMNEDQNLWHHWVYLEDNELTLRGLMTPYGDIDLGQQWLR